jgi:lipoprotein-releasing system permease protein
VNLPFEFFIATRYLLARRKQAFISVISFISTLGVAVGVLALVVALALMTGLQGELRDRILGSMAHVYVWKPGGISDYRAEIRNLRQLDVPGIVGAGPAIQGKGVITYGQAQTFINLKGIDPELEQGVTDIASAMREGSIGALVDPAEGGIGGILIGRQLAASLGVGVGDHVSLLTTQGTLSPMGILPRSRPAQVVGIFELGLQEFDAEWGFVSREFARRLLGADAPEMIQIRVADIDAAPDVADRIEASGSYVAQDWSDLNESLFSALWIEKMAISITIGLIVMVAALQIVASLVLLVMEKSRDIGILKTMGTSPKRISRIFMMQGLIIGIVGTAVGAISGLALCWVLDHYRLVRIPQDVYQIAYVPFVVEPLDFTIVVVSAVVICFLATIYPSRQAARLDPVQALRFE